MYTQPYQTENLLPISQPNDTRRPTTTSPIEAELSRQAYSGHRCSLGRWCRICYRPRIARAGSSAIAVIDLHGVSDELMAKQKIAATQAGRPEPYVLSCTVDNAKPEDFQAMHGTVVQRFGGSIYVVINNAAHIEPHGPILESDPDVYWRIWEVNLSGVINVARSFLPTQLSSRVSDNAFCTMINVSSSGALSVRGGSSSYRTSKLT
ncbi:hypothetical protein P171DRAFT_507561 [Karstenula rhodostoma CBS 690.94]|uniref:NAD(P)-binding protein n=1 Tax=Karstenula rhodostoma CBS 690.94 TaxID=1392251 RepID=A0A9P4PW22_9PLEO|nr:hypothetical protein P171DRAFT_507561 [Karstenula rhodostoma CBS 690.94]